MASSTSFLASISLVLAAISHHILWMSPAFDLFLRVVPFVRLQIEVYCSVIDRVVFDDFPNDSPYVVLESHSLQKRSDSIQLRVAHIIVPAGARDCVLRLEQESNGRVVDDDHIFHGSAKPSQVFHEGIIVVKGAVLSEELVGTKSIWIQLCDQRLGVL